jgi:hypothetical protein
MADAVHFSRLKLMAMSPAHYRAAAKRGTAAMGFGTVVHALVLGGDAIVYDGERKGGAWSAFKALVGGAEYTIYDGARRGKAWEESRDEARANGLAIVTSEDVERAEDARRRQAERIAAKRYTLPIVTAAEYERARECADAVLAHPIAADLFSGETEIPLRWTYLGRDCAGQLDAIKGAWLSELKTAACAEPSWFTRQFFRMAYHAQLAWYSEAARRNGYTISDRYVVAVETRRPYAITVGRVTERAIEEGERLIRTWMERLVVCEEADAWPAYSQSVIDIDVAQDVELIYPEDMEEEAA